MTEAEWTSATDPEPLLKYLRGNPYIWGGGMLPQLSCGSEPNRVYVGPSADFPEDKFGRIVECYLEQLEKLPFGETDQAILRAYRRHEESDELRKELVNLCAANGPMGIHPDPNAKLPDRALHWSSSPFGVFRIALDAAVFLTRFEFREQVESAELDEAVRNDTWSSVIYNIPGFRDSFRLRFSRLPSVLRDIFGNPFRPVAFDPRWQTSDVVGLARAIYDDKAFERMPILADALMDAGCEKEQIIAHCRGDGPHVRGCWVVDLVLGKE